MNIETHIPLNIEKFWSFFFTDSFEQFQLSYVNLESIELLEEKPAGSIVHRTVKVTPNVPGALRGIIAKVLGKEDLFYTDVQQKDLENYTINFNTTPPILADSIKIGGTFSAVATGDNSITLSLKGDARVGIFAVGGLIENAILTELKKTFKDLPRIVTAYAEAHP